MTYPFVWIRNKSMVADAIPKVLLPKKNLLDRVQYMLTNIDRYQEE
jgi:hypothetical protein